MISRLPPRLRPGDRVRLVSPASRPDPVQVQRGASILSDWGLRVEIAAHAFDSWGHYLAGRDQDRLADLNGAFRDPSVRAVLSTTGGKGSYRIVDRLDFTAISRDPKPFVGFSDLTAVHLARWQQCGVPGFHGPHIAWNDDYYGAVAAERLRAALMDAQALVIRQDPREPTAAVTTSGVATGILMGGTLGVMSSAVGWACPRLEGMILLIEAVDQAIGSIDRSLTQLLRSGALHGVAGVAVGQFIRSADPQSGKWSMIEVLGDRLSTLGVPVLGGLPIGHGPAPFTVPLGTLAHLDAGAGELTVEPGVS
jgi:muramoyltetrapeptide carboxypeptidase